MDLARRRFSNQFIDGSRLTDPVEVVRALGAVQAQDYHASLWAIGLRLHEQKLSTVEDAIIDRRIVRTWPMRGTLHFVANEDVRWILDLLAPRTLERNAARLRRQFGIDSRLINRSRKLLEAAFSKQQVITRERIYELLESRKIQTAKLRGMHVLWWLAREQFICCGPRQGKQPSFVLTDDWVEPAPSIPRDEALARLAYRYFAHHGPATVADFAWWLGLTLSDARRGTQAAAADLQHESKNEVTWWFGEEQRTRRRAAAHLLPVYDEFTVGYADRSATLDLQDARHESVGHGIFRAPIVIEGRIAGSWSRQIRKDQILVTVTPMKSFTSDQMKQIGSAAQRYASFIGSVAHVTRASTPD